MRILLRFLFLITMTYAVFLHSCTVNYSFTGADIPAEAKTVSVALFGIDGPEASLAPPGAADQFTDVLNATMLTQTNLDLINKDGDLQFSGYIIKYTNTPVAPQSDTESSNRNRLSITVSVTYTNSIEPDKSFENKQFSQFADFDANIDLTSIENELQTEIFETITQDIFNSSLGSW
jgi:hypothetical protein